MKSGIKCPGCNSCLDTVWLMPKRFYHCWLEKEFYNKQDGKLVKVDIFIETGITKESLEIAMENYYEKSS